jgi:hypothetical protein
MTRLYCSGSLAANAALPTPVVPAVLLLAAVAGVLVAPTPVLLLTVALEFGCEVAQPKEIRLMDKSIRPANRAVKDCDLFSGLAPALRLMFFNLLFMSPPYTGSIISCFVKIMRIIKIRESVF